MHLLSIFLATAITLLVPQGGHGNGAEHIIQFSAPPAHSFERLKDADGDIVQPTVLVLHYTECSLAETLSIFSGNRPAKVASHYTISEDGYIFQHVPEDRAARHAGRNPGDSVWCLHNTLNVHSIGIEHVNLGFRHAAGESPGIVRIGSDLEWYPFDHAQMQASIALCQAIMRRHNIPARNVVGHSDIAPKRKMDPGPLFPWKEFADAGIGAWPPGNTPTMFPCFKRALAKGTLDAWMQQHLHIWGYRLPDSSTSLQDIVQAFQMHFRPRDISGAVDIETATLLHGLIYRYMIDTAERPDVVGRSDCPCQRSVK